MTTTTSHTVVIGAGPVGLTAAAHLARRRMPFTVLEAGDRVGASMRQWGHVRLFSPWALDIDPDAAALLRERGWERAEPDDHPTGAELVERYLEPLAAHPSITPTSNSAPPSPPSPVEAAAASTAATAATPFIVRYVQDETEHEITATAVIDASGTWTTPNPLGAAGIPALGEAAAADHITYGIPDVAGADRQRFAGKRIAVAGGGHSAANVLLDLASSPRGDPGPPSPGCCAGPTPPDSSAAAPRTNCPSAAASARPSITSWPRRRHRRRAQVPDRPRDAHRRRRDPSPTPTAESGRSTRSSSPPGSAPTSHRSRELRLDLDEIVEARGRSPRSSTPTSTPAAPCRRTAFMELSHPEPGFFIVGMKSYGRAPTFLLRPATNRSAPSSPPSPATSTPRVASSSSSRSPVRAAWVPPPRTWRRSRCRSRTLHQPSRSAAAVDRSDARSGRHRRRRPGTAPVIHPFSARPPRAPEARPVEDPVEVGPKTH